MRIVTLLATSAIPQAPTPTPYDAVDVILEPTFKSIALPSIPMPESKNGSHSYPPRDPIWKVFSKPARSDPDAVYMWCKSHWDKTWVECYGVYPELGQPGADYGSSVAGAIDYYNVSQEKFNYCVLGRNTTAIANCFDGDYLATIDNTYVWKQEGVACAQAVQWQVNELGKTLWGRARCWGSEPYGHPTIKYMHIGYVEGTRCYFNHMNCPPLRFYVDSGDVIWIREKLNDYDTDSTATGSGIGR